MTCEYKDIFGKPGEGIHAYRIGGFALADIAGLLMIVIAYVKYYGTDFIDTLIVGLLLTIFIHWLFCVPTALNKKLGLA